LEERKMKKVFITGGAGFIGSYVVREFLKHGYKVYIYDAFKQYLTVNPGQVSFDLRQRLKEVWKQIKVIRGDTMNKDFLRRALNQVRPDIIIHTAALPLASEAIEHTEEALDSILLSTFNMLEILRDFKHSCRFVYISSSMVYGDFKKSVVSEDHPTDPKDIYGAFKRATEIVVKAFGKRHNIDFSIIRPSAVYGPYDANKRVLYQFIRGSLEGKPIQIAGDGSMKLDFTYVKDLAAGIYRVAVSSLCRGKIYNMTRGEAKSLAEAVGIIKKHIPGVRVQRQPVPAYMPKRGTLNVSKAKHDAGYAPEYSLERGLKEYIEHLKKNPF